MGFLGAGVVDVDLGAAFGVGVGVGAVVHHLAGEGDDVPFGGRRVVVAAGTQAGGVVGHVAVVGVGDEGEETDGEGRELHVDAESLRLWKTVGKFATIELKRSYERLFAGTRMGSVDVETSVGQALDSLE